MNHDIFFLNHILLSPSIFTFQNSFCLILYEFMATINSNNNVDSPKYVVECVISI